MRYSVDCEVARKTADDREYWMRRKQACDLAPPTTACVHKITGETFRVLTSELPTKITHSVAIVAPGKASTWPDLVKQSLTM